MTRIHRIVKIICVNMRQMGLFPLNDMSEVHKNNQMKGIYRNDAKESVGVY